MMKFAILFALVAAAVAEPIPRFNTLSPTGRIVGGEATSIDQVPYQVSLRIMGTPSCGGSIISVNWILTAAHCIIYPIGWYTVRSGSTLSNTGGTVTSLSVITTHPSYTVNEFNVPSHDIAVLRLSSMLTFTSVQAPIGLYSTGQESVVGSPAVVTGWGALAESGSASFVLQTVTVPIVSKESCDSAYTGWGGLPDGQICAGLPTGNLDSCQGDSGGPLAIDGVLAGVVSWGNGCARAGYPGVYTEVAAYRDWITTSTGV